MKVGSVRSELHGFYNTDNQIQHNQILKMNAFYDASMILGCGFTRNLWESSFYFYFLTTSANICILDEIKIAILGHNKKSDKWHYLIWREGGKGRLQENQMREPIRIPLAWLSEFDAGLIRDVNAQTSCTGFGTDRAWISLTGGARHVFYIF